MNKLAFAALAASAALVPATAQAQSGPAGAGHSWGRGGGGHVVRPHPGGTTVIRHHNRGGGFRGGFVGGGFFGGNVGGGGNQIVILPGNWGQFHYQPLHPGAMLHPFWHGQQFQVRNWRRYGFAAPPRGHRWVRHFDDAYLIDGRGHVRDFRHNLDWDQYGEAWVHEGGIPRYAGDGDYRPDDRDYAAVAGAQGHGAQAGWDYREYGHAAPPHPHPGHAVPHPGYAVPQPHPMPHPGYVLPHPMPGYGYSTGYGVAGGSVMVGVVTITETTTTVNAAAAAPQYVEEIIEEEVVHRPRVRRPRPAPPRPRAVRPPPGERG